MRREVELRLHQLDGLRSFRGIQALVDAVRQSRRVIRKEAEAALAADGPEVRTCAGAREQDHDAAAVESRRAEESAACTRGMTVRRR